MINGALNCILCLSDLLACRALESLYGIQYKIHENYTGYERELFPHWVDDRPHGCPWLRHGTPVPRIGPRRKRRAYANDLGDERSLVAVTDNENQSKADQDPATWMPPYEPARCGYISEWVTVKLRWG